MAIEHIFDSASSIMTVISFTTFLGILLWTFVLKGGKDFETQAALPFADDVVDHADRKAGESGHG
ncbi:cbb3-type cytochrome c oxidase subunit 3 [Massilia sp. P8910]|uniref:Cbb3-type cytochrome c oxidase subunit 3 n=1 Tax=Massilia antarctica TaxID=2765360 RepID=A0AA49A646_9BURK|nr:cbb3-type cytochrome c oxidase subunit 3 [Massilia antarctica]MCE3604156.1 cbb3-type cytochrome c oxidase subunit 3 [Massilia antarctica]QPI48063.1 cbb3-type cytochrome c oxidase subunit 3 [Massilia antarctica]